MSDIPAQLSEPMTLMRTKDVKHLADRIEELEAENKRLRLEVRHANDVADAAIDGAKELKVKLSKAVEDFITVNRMAEGSGFISDHPICDGCCGIYHLTNSTIAELKGETDD